MGNEKWSPIVFLRTCKLPREVKGCTVLDHDGNYNVYVNDKYLHQASDILEHEIAHVRDGHFFSMGDLKKLEAEADNAVITADDIRRLDIRAC